jgi:RNA polymerase sigma-70 factor (ECF subfamily)
MLGSAFDAEDAVQETMVRAWKSFDRFEGRSSVRSWLYRIATNVCLDLLNGRQRRALPMDLSSPGAVSEGPTAPLPEHTWVEPIPSAMTVPAADDPAEVALAHESIRLAFVAALQLLPPRQRAILILREVLRWRATEVASLLDTTTVSVNSALQRARATLAASQSSVDDPSPPDDPERRLLLARYVDAFERFDVDELVSLLRDDASLTMPPDPFWLRGRDDLRAWWVGPGAGCAGSRVFPIEVNGTPGVATYKRDGRGSHRPFSIQVVDVSGGRISAIHAFLDTERLFPLFGFPAQLDR